MPRLRIRHETTYTYSEPVKFGAWRLLMRPLDTHATRLIEASLETPPGSLKWAYDAYGMADRVILAPFIAPATDDHDHQYVDWLHAQAGPNDEPALEFLKRINSAIHAGFNYGVREAPGVQSPSETVAFMSGTCRDFAWLMIESVRRMGFAARFATGYLHSPGQTIRGAGATHAWCEVFLPDIGWTEFDPTNALVESASLIRVAAARTSEEAHPMDGAIFGNASSQLHVEVDVDLIDPEAPWEAPLSAAAG